MGPLRRTRRSLRATTRKECWKFYSLASGPSTPRFSMSLPIRHLNLFSQPCMHAKFRSAEIFLGAFMPITDFTTVADKLATNQIVQVFAASQNGNSGYHI